MQSNFSVRRLVRRSLRGAAALALVSACAGGTQTASATLARADALWAQRAEGQRDARARPEPVRAAIAAYEGVLADDPGSLEANWKLLRALWFAADFASDDPKREREIYEQAQTVAERALAVLAARVGGQGELARATPEALRTRLPAADRSHAAQLYFWHAINLGAWSRLAGLLQSVRAGVANRIHEATLRSIALDPGVEQGGAIRLLSRLHSELPRVPLVTSWVDASRAVPLAERALAEYPEHPGNAYLLGLAILSNAPERRGEGIVLIERTAALEPRSEQLVEDLAIQLDARERLAAMPKEVGGPS